MGKKNSINKLTSEKVYNIIRERVITGSLKPGDKIFDQEIAEELNVSRTPVREAIKMLEQQQVVRSIPGKFTVVDDIPNNAVEQWYEPMLILQKLATKQAAKYVTDKDIADLEKLNKTFILETKNHKTPLECLKADKAFHDKILELSRNLVVIEFCKTLWIHILRLELRYFENKGTFVDSISHHQQLIDSFRLHDSYSASLAMEMNWNNTIIGVNNVIVMEKEKHPKK